MCENRMILGGVRLSKFVDDDRVLVRVPTMNRPMPFPGGRQARARNKHSRARRRRARDLRLWAGFLSALPLCDGTPQAKRANTVNAEGQLVTPAAMAMGIASCGILVSVTENIKDNLSKFDIY
ncbi:hypothetical protein CHELA40_13661 [Chelatococcus asaccharovorans]|nr:hypothetical protein CHELA40_13661 [Chelatococcus asaccharovorans]CAH1676503.1 hypothetical protein CHELA17_61964 [Chelatococcus asaccharovorans]